MKHLSDNVIFIPVYNENRTGFWSTVSGGSPSRSGLSPSGFFWSGSAGNYVENVFVGDVCTIYFGAGSTGTATITLDGNTLVSGLSISTLPRCGNYYIYEVKNLSYDSHVLRITVVTSPIHVMGMLAVKENLPFFQFAPIYNANTIYYLNSTTVLVSTTTPLNANATYTSPFIDLESDGSRNWILVTIYSNASGTLYIEFSNDNSNADAVQTISYTGGTVPYIQPIMRVARYVRVRYVNGTTAQTTFRLHVRGVYSPF